MTELSDIWRTNFPDWRFGQFMSNALGWIQSKHGDIFFPEEDRMLKYFHEYVASLSSSKPDPIEFATKDETVFTLILNW
jgi:hypothetical protein